MVVAWNMRGCDLMVEIIPDPALQVVKDCPYRYVGMIEIIPDTASQVVKDCPYRYVGIILDSCHYWTNNYHCCEAVRDIDVCPLGLK